MDIKKISLVLLSAFLITACGGNKDETSLGEDNRPPVSVRTETVGEGLLSGTYEAIGTVRAKVSSVVSSKVIGNVVSVHFREGDRITKGKLLVEIDDRDARNQLAMAEAGLAEAQSAREEVEKAIQAAKSAQTAAEANASLTESTFKRFEELLKRNSVSQQEFDEIKAKRTAAQAEAQRAGEMLGALESKRMQVDAKISQAKVNLENASLYSSYFQIQAPFSGVVTQKSVEVGQLASPGIPLLTVDDPASYRLEALVEESRVRTIKNGDPVPVQIDAVAGQIDGNVEEVLPVADPASRTVPVRITLPGASGLRSGMFGKARFPGGDRTVLMVSSSCLVSRGQLVGLFIVDENSRARFRLIKPGREIGQKTEILSGLEAGDKVVLSPDHEVSDGRQIRTESTELNRIYNPVRNSGVNS